MVPRESGSSGRPMMGVRVACGNGNVDLILSVDMLGPSEITARSAGGREMRIAQRSRVAEPCATTVAKEKKS